MYSTVPALGHKTDEAIVSESHIPAVRSIESGHMEEQSSISVAEVDFNMAAASVNLNNDYYLNAKKTTTVSTEHSEGELASLSGCGAVLKGEDSQSSRRDDLVSGKNEEDTLRSYDGLPSYTLSGDDDAINVLDPSLLEKMQNGTDVEMEQEQKQFFLPQKSVNSDIDGAQQQKSCQSGDVWVNGDSRMLASETLQSIHESSAFIGPVLPSYLKQDSTEVITDVPVSAKDKPRATLPEAHVESVQLPPEDFRYNLTVNSVPRLIAAASADFQRAPDNFLRGCKWSPDGNSVLTNSNDNCLRVFCPFDNTDASEMSEKKQIVAKVKMKECSQIYDFAWHPKMNSSQPDYCRIACTCSGIPIHLWDSTTGQIVANYRAYDQFDEITAAYSLSFSPDGTKLYAGYNRTIRIFDTDYPVRSCQTVKTYDSQRKDGQSGIISCFAYSPDGNGLYVAGSYSRHIGMYDSACDKLVCLMQGQHGGVTHLMFSPDATKLYSGGRKDAEILCWDVRNMDRILFSALRDVKTNQRIYFDLSQSGRYLISGNHDGTVAFWDTLSPVEEINGDIFLKPCSQFQAHGDCVNGVSFNPKLNILATASGQRHFRNFDHDSSDSAEDERMEEEAEPWDFSLRLWQIPLTT